MLHRFILLLALATTFTAQAQTPQPEPPLPGYCPVSGYAPGTLDSCFGYTNRGEGLGTPFQIHALATQRDGKVLIGGMFPTYHGQVSGKIVRLNTDGTFDKSFRADTGFEGPLKYDGYVYGITALPTGKILVAGDFTHYRGVPCSRVVRLNADGTLDAGFSAPDFDYRALSTAYDSAGKVLVNGLFRKINGVRHGCIARLNADGTLDAGFNPDTLLAVNSLGIQPGGKIVYGMRTGGIGRLHPDGSPDTTFARIPYPVERNVTVLSDGRILVWGTSNIQPAQPYLARLHPDGQPDTTGFRRVFKPLVTDLKVDSAGRIYIATVGPDSTGMMSGMLRFSPDGRPDPAFVRTSFPIGISLLAPAQGSAQRLYYSYLEYNREVYQGRYLSTVNATDLNGSRLADFQNSSDYFDGGVYRIQAMPNGSILAEGDFLSIGGVTVPHVALIKPSGLPDQRFSTPRDEFPRYIPQPDGKVMGMKFYNVGGFGYMAHYDSLGRKLDSIPFTAPFTQSGTQHLFPLTKGKALAFGGFSRFARIQANGHADTAFRFDLYETFRRSIIITPYDAIPLSGERILLGGGFSRKLVLLDSTGAIDRDYWTRLPFDTTSGLGSNFVYDLQEQPDGKILVAGQFRFKERPANEFYTLCRLNVDGSLDQTFQLRPMTETGYFYTWKITVQPDGKILVHNPNGRPYSGLERLLPNGTRDAAFQAEVGVDVGINSMLVQGNGVVVAGNFTRAGGKPRSYLARFLLDGLVATQEEAVRPNGLRLYPNPTTGLVWVETTGNAQLLALDGRILQETTPANGRAAFDLKLLDPGLYLVRSGGQAARVVKE